MALLISDQGMVMAVADPLIDGIIVVTSTGLKVVETLVTLATNSSAGDEVTEVDSG